MSMSSTLGAAQAAANGSLLAYQRLARSLASRRVLPVVDAHVSEYTSSKPAKGLAGSATPLGALLLREPSTSVATCTLECPPSTSSTPRSSTTRTSTAGPEGTAFLTLPSFSSSSAERMTGRIVDIDTAQTDAEDVETTTRRVTLHIVEPDEAVDIAEQAGDVTLGSVVPVGQDTVVASAVAAVGQLLRFDRGTDGSGAQAQRHGKAYCATGTSGCDRHDTAHRGGV